MKNTPIESLIAGWAARRLDSGPMRRLYLLCLVSLVVLARGAITQAGSASTAGSTVSGVVLEDADRNGVQGAGDAGLSLGVDIERRVDGEVAWFVSVFADAQGRFEFTDVPPGDYTVAVHSLKPVVMPTGRRQHNSFYRAEWGFKVEAGKDVTSLTFMIEPGEPRPGPRDPAMSLFPIGSRQVGDIPLPEVPSAPGLPHRVLAPPGALSLVFARLVGPGESHAARADNNLCAEVPVVNGVADLIPRFTVRCPAGTRIGVAASYGETREGGRLLRGLRVDPPIEWRLPLPGEDVRVVTASVVPPQVGDGGLR